MGNLIADLIGGGLKGLADSASSIIKDFKADPNKVLEADQKIKELENKTLELTNTLTASIEQETTKRLQSQLEENKSARDREIQIATSDKAPILNKIITPILGLFVTCGFFSLLGYMLKYEVPIGNKDILNVMLGSLGTAWIMIVGYYFGSSLGSAQKSEQLEKLTNK